MTLIVIFIVSVFLSYFIVKSKNRIKVKRIKYHKLSKEQRSYRSKWREGGNNRVLGVPYYLDNNKNKEQELSEIKATRLLTNIVNHYPGVYLLNSLCFNKNDVFSHAIVTSDSIILISIKYNMGRGVWSIEDNNNTLSLVKNYDNNNSINNIHLDNYMNMLKRQFPDVRVNGIVAVDSMDTTIGNNDTNSFRLITLDGLLQEVNLLLYSDNSKVSENAMTKTIVNSLRKYIKE